MQIKEKIISFLKNKGPSLPVHISKETGLSILFASAFLSDLLSDKEIKISNMHVGSSPLYMLQGQEPLLENFSQYLKNKEKEAFIFLKEKKFAKDRELEPAIRVALREIKDFAIPFQRDNEIFWRYFLANESDFNEKPKEIISEVVKEKVIEPITSNEIIEVKENPEKKGIDILEEAREIKNIIKKKTESIKKSKKKVSKKQNFDKDKFFNKVKSILSDKKIEIIGIEEIGITKIIFRVKEKEEFLIIAYNKKKIGERDIINAYKKSEELGIPYKILAWGEPLKRFDNLINAVKSLKSIEKIE